MVFKNARMIKQTAIMKRQEQVVQKKKTKDNVNKVILTHVSIVQETIS